MQCILCADGRSRSGKDYREVIFMINSQRVLNDIIKTSQMGINGINVVMDKTSQPALRQALTEHCGPCWSLNSHTYERETGLFHWEWAFEV
mgnify:CR=1 FL=1